MAVLYFRNKNGEMVEVPAIVGRSAYQAAVKNGFKGTESEWLASLKGADGHTPVKGVDYVDGYTPVKGVDYDDGYTPVKGMDYWTEADKDEIKNYVASEVIGADVVAVANRGRALTAADAGMFLRVDEEATISVPVNVFPVGVEIEIFRNTADPVTIEPEYGALFAIPSNTELVAERQQLSDQYASVVLKHIGDNVWSVQGAV